MSSGMESLYQEVILDLSRSPHGRGLEEHAAAESHQLNPTCGDEITLQLHLDADGEHIRAVRWEGHGCAISQASASLFSDLAPGLTTAELAERIELFRVAMRSRGTIEPDEELLGDAVALSGVSRYVARVKCAMLAWVAGEDAIQQVAAAH
ncbi:Fe-S cluster assembly sulfur transfer protein SufU [Galbitalea soli]|uniref:SUF system NifU family Fe-S cluster assembly protein n=1 Tax=Galbitalea soli TaxID=1268042 RepID=A0A7C9PPW2_9MICO|nr:SUF system NifU family Fe-S cluster assembly protein [Galbitalea soli]NEM92547.1 SUF system NifU family Fe-S cluster assembly protein [Galbitalea soli]NYJ29584.1 nitrogen fixation NifU-like protein [Galbitalea soli]